jgi:hypothetical protein
MALTPVTVAGVVITAFRQKSGGHCISVIVAVLGAGTVLGIIWSANGRFCISPTATVTVTVVVGGRVVVVVVCVMMLREVRVAPSVISTSVS